MLKKLIPIISVLAIAPFVNAQDAAPAPAQNAAAPQLTPAKAAPISAEDRKLFLQGLGWILCKQSGLTSQLDIPEEDYAAILEGFGIALKDDKNEFSKKIEAKSQAYEAFIAQLQESAMKKAEEKAKALSAKNNEKGKKYIEDTLAKDKTFTKLPSGVLVKITAKGDETKKPTKNSLLTVRYTGKLIDGTIFDSSARDDKNQAIQHPADSKPIDFEIPLTQLIPAWVEILPTIGKGGKCTLIIPADQAYGDRAAGPIEPGSTLIFDIDLVDFKDAPAPEATPAEAPATTK